MLSIAPRLYLLEMCALFSFIDLANAFISILEIRQFINAIQSQYTYNHFIVQSRHQTNKPQKSGTYVGMYQCPLLTHWTNFCHKSIKI